MPGKGFSPLLRALRVAGMPVVIGAGFVRPKGRQQTLYLRHDTADFIPETADKDNRRPLPATVERLLREWLAQLGTGHRSADRLPCEYRRTACKNQKVPKNISDHGA